MSIKSAEVSGHDVKCDQCGMIFTTEVSLEKHKEKFCIGVPDSGNNREDIIKNEGSIIVKDHDLDNYNDTSPYHGESDTNYDMNKHEASFYISSPQPQPKIQSPQPDLKSHPISQSPPINSNFINKNKVLRSARPDQDPQNHYQQQQQQQQPQQTQRSRTPLKPVVADKQRKAIEELEDYKNKKQIEQSVKDLEDVLIRDTLRDKKLVDSIQSTPKIQSPDPNDFRIKSHHANDPYKSLLKEYSELKKKEKLILKEIFDIKPSESANELKKLVNSSDLYLNDLKHNSNSNSVTSMHYSKSRNSFDNIADMDSYEQNQFIKAHENNKENYKNSSSKLPNLTSNSNNSMSNDKNQTYLKYIQTKTFEIEKERRDIQNKLETLKNDDSYQLPVTSQQSINRILIELKDQQKVNEAALDLLRKRIINENTLAHNTNSKSINNMMSSGNFGKQSTLNTRTKPVQLASSSYHNKPYSLIDDSLSPEEIRNMRLNYLNSGGHDARVLSQFTEMEYDSRFSTNKLLNYNGYDITDTTDTNLLNKELNFKLDGGDILKYNQLSSVDTDQNVTTDLDEKIRKADLDNKRLQLELEMLQDKYRTLNYGSSDYTVDLLQTRYDYDRQLDRVKLMLNRYEKPLDYYLPPISSRNRYASFYDEFTNPPLDRNLPVLSNYEVYPIQQQQQQQQHQPPLQSSRIDAQTRNHFLTSLNTGGIYDPNGGFVMFIDFINNLDASFSAARLVTCLHHPKSGLGEPSVLPIINCESYIDSGRPTAAALISTKQPVPRCPPQQALTILVEVQMSNKRVNEGKLASCAWTKLPLFDPQNQLLTGRWKMPLRQLPLKSEAGFSTISSVPQFGNVEIFYRLVHARDANEQTNIPISPTYAPHYNYPPQYEESYELNVPQQNNKFQQINQNQNNNNNNNLYNNNFNNNNNNNNSNSNNNPHNSPINNNNNQQTNNNQQKPTTLTHLSRNTSVQHIKNGSDISSSKPQSKRSETKISTQRDPKINSLVKRNVSVKKK